MAVQDGKKFEPNAVSRRCDCMAELSPEQKRTDVMFGNAVLGVLLLAAISGALFWAILPS